MSTVSMLWTRNDPRTPFPDTSFINDLHVDELIRLRSERVGEVDRSLAEFFTQDPATMRARTGMFFELLETPGLYEELSASFSRLSDIYALQNAKSGTPASASTEQLLYSIREMEGYIEFLNGIKEIFTKNHIRSELLHSLWEEACPLCTGEDYDALCAAVEKQSHTIGEIRSITVGVNLDPTLRPVEAGVLAVNDQSYVSGEFVSHLLRMQFKKDAFTCSAPLTPTSRRLTPQEQAAMRESVNSALGKIFGDSLKAWAAVIRGHIMGNLRALAPLSEEWHFIAAAVDTLQRLRQAGCPLCAPTITDNRADERVEGLCHPLLLLNGAHQGALVRNDLTFDGDGRLYILTGPNSGGKSIYLQSAGLCYAMLHLGLPLPAATAVIAPTDAILTHMSDIRRESYRHGRLGTECEHIHKISHLLSERSLILFDEPLAGTNATEAVVISSEVLAAYAEIGVRGIWVTHLHDLCRLPATLGDMPSRVSCLSAQMDASGARLFTVERKIGDTHSYAMDIARGFHLTREEILAERK